MAKKDEGGSSKAEWAEAAAHMKTVNRAQGIQAKGSMQPHTQANPGNPAAYLKAMTALKFVKQADSGPLDPNASVQERQTVQDERVRRQQAAHMAPEDKPRKRK